MAATFMRKPVGLAFLLFWLSCLGQISGFVAPGQRAYLARYVSSTRRVHSALCVSNNEISNGGFSLLRLGGSQRENLNPFINRKKGSGNLQVSMIQTAQLCLNQQKRDHLKKEILRDFPLVPASVVDAALEVVAQGFQSVAPEILQECMTPGGLDKYREPLTQAVVETVCEQDAVKHFPLLSSRDKKKLVQTMVTLLVDQWVLDDSASWLLASPTTRLNALYAEIESIKRLEMTRLSVLWFSLKRHFLRYSLLTAAVSFAVYTQVAHAGSVGNAARAIFFGLTMTGKWIIRQFTLRIWIFGKILGITLANHATMSYGPWDCLWVH